MFKYEDVYLSLGSNLGDCVSIIKRALLCISNISETCLLKTSRFYQTTPVSDLPQNDYVNAACKLRTSLNAQELFRHLKKVETDLGKRQKPKNAPRKIDLDILLFGSDFIHSDTLQIPHPRWRERLFVLIPLLDLAEEITYPINNQGAMETLKLKEFIHSFPNPHHEHVLPLNKTAE
jgi:2-amino-4-hydroxy-6-hydroxymethyldihydropteridine diphosphokinase